MEFEERKKELIKVITDRGDTFEHILNLYVNSVCDTVDDDEEIRELAKPYLTDFELNGDKWGVPPIGTIVETLINKFKEIK
jgi:hypothetical protein